LHDIAGENEFDVITSFEVLEHIHNGKEDVACIHRMLRIGGLFYFTTPNFNSFSRRWLKGKWTVIEYPEHLTYYTPGTLHKLMQNSGFSKQKMITTGISVQRFSASVGCSREKVAGKDEQMRTRIAGNSLLGLVRSTVNFFLNIFRMGDTIKGWYLRR
jgi:predicted SAM-dependent methyltransferase